MRKMNSDLLCNADFVNFFKIYMYSDIIAKHFITKIQSNVSIFMKGLLEQKFSINAYTQ